MRSSDVLILGGGPAGMAAGMELSRAGKTATIVEREGQIGGLAKTIEFRLPHGTFRTDIGPHRFFSKNKYLYDFIEDLLGEQWIKVSRQTRFFVDGKFYFYPVKMSNVLSQIGIGRAFRALRDFLIEKVRSFIHPRAIRTFEDYTLTTFGRTLAEFNMLNYTEKIWGIPCSEISKDWATQRIAGLTIGSTIRNMLFKLRQPKTLTQVFYYPEFGSGTIYESIADRLRKTGSRILTDSRPTVIRWKDRKIEAVTVRTPAGEETFSPSAVVSSVPVTEAIKLFEPPAPAQVLKAASALRFRSQVYLFLTIAKDSVSADNWVYFPDKNIPFGRISEMKNFSKKMSPSGKTSLMVEYFCFTGDPIWTMSPEALTELTVTWLSKLGFVSKSDVLSYHCSRSEYAYPIYDLTYREHQETIMRWFDSFDNFYAVGRPGRFRYTNQDHSLEMGILAARSIVEGKRRDVEEVGAEKEYFERGYVPTTA